MRWLRRLFILSLVVMMTGCIGLKVPVVPPPGGLFTQVRMPITTDFSETPAGGPRTGKVETLFFREPFFGTSYAWGDASIERAAREGGLTKVYYADAEFLAVIGLFGMFTIEAHGE